MAHHLTCAVALLLASSAHAQQPTQVTPDDGPTHVMPGAHLEAAPAHADIDTRGPRAPRWGLVGVGTLVFLLGWIPDVGVSYGFNHPQAAHALVPIGGPFIQWNDKFGVDVPPGTDPTIAAPLAAGNRIIQDAVRTLLVTSSILQIGGTLIAVIGLVAWKEEPRPPPKCVARAPRVLPQFAATPGGFAFGLSGGF